MPRNSKTWTAETAPRSGGRIPGPNKKTLWARQILEQHGCNPVEQLAKTALDEKVPVELRIRCLETLMPYVFPKLAAIEVSGPDGTPLQMLHAHFDGAMANPRARSLAEQLATELSATIVGELTDDDRKSLPLPPGYRAFEDAELVEALPAGD